MTRRQRAQVVELLRCAADACALNRGHVWFDVIAGAIGASDETVEHARAVANCVMDEEPYASERRAHIGDVMPNRWNLSVALEAAARVEEGWTP